MVSYTLREGSLCMPSAAETKMVVPNMQLTAAYNDYLLQLSIFLVHYIHLLLAIFTCAGTSYGCHGRYRDHLYIAATVGPGPIMAVTDGPYTVAAIGRQP